MPASLAVPGRVASPHEDGLKRHTMSNSVGPIVPQPHHRHLALPMPQGIQGVLHLPLGNRAMPAARLTAHVLLSLASGFAGGLLALRLPL